MKMTFSATDPVEKASKLSTGWNFAGLFEES
jgi:hypothetical protein